MYGFKLQNQFILTVHWISCREAVRLTDKKAYIQFSQLEVKQEIYNFSTGHVSFLKWRRYVSVFSKMAALVEFVVGLIELDLEAMDFLTEVPDIAICLVCYTVRFL